MLIAKAFFGKPLLFLPFNAVLIAQAIGLQPGTPFNGHASPGSFKPRSVISSQGHASLLIGHTARALIPPTPAATLGACSHALPSQVNTIVVMSLRREASRGESKPA